MVLSKVNGLKMKFMKKMLPIIFTGLLALGFVACEKDYQGRLNLQTNPGLTSDKASLQYYNATLNSVRTYVYIDNVLLSGTASTYATTPLYPGTSPSYIVVQPGTRSVVIKDTLATTTQPALTVSGSFDAGAKYTIFSYDTLNRAKALLVKDNVVIPADSTSRVRFVNLIYSATTVPNVDIYSVRRAQNIFTNVALSASTDFIPFFSGAPVSDTLHVRATGTTTNLASLNSFNPLRQRSYTLVFRGRYQTTGTTGVARTLTSFLTY
jgi:hypothetical protein